jgi:hypothetical protein
MALLRAHSKVQLYKYIFYSTELSIFFTYWCYYQKVQSTPILCWYFRLNNLNILISTFCVSADGFQGLSKAFRY